MAAPRSTTERYWPQRNGALLSPDAPIGVGAPKLVARFGRSYVRPQGHGFRAWAGDTEEARAAQHPAPMPKAHGHVSLGRTRWAHDAKNLANPILRNGRVHGG